MAPTITFQQLDEQWPLPNIASLVDLIEDRERSEALRSLLDAQGGQFSDVFSCANVLFQNGFLSFDLFWEQSDADIDIAISLPKDIPTSSIFVEQGPESVTVRVKPFDKPILEAKLWERVDVDDSQWTVERRASVSLLKLELHKHLPVWWTQLFKGPDQGPPCSNALSPDRAYTYAQTMEMSGEDPSKVFEMYRLAAERGHALAASRVGNAYIDGDKAAGVQKDQSAALHYLMIGAENGNHECMFQVGHAFQHGIGFEPDFDKAVFWYTQAADAGRHARAAYFLGHIHHNFAGRAPDPAKAAYWWGRAAELEYPDAMFNLALYYYNGAEGVPQCKVKALELFKKATTANPSFTELLHQNSIDLEVLEAEVASATPLPRPSRLRRKRSKRSSSWSAVTVGAGVIGVAVVLGFAWYNRDAIRRWVRGTSPKSQVRSQSQSD